MNKIAAFSAVLLLAGMGAAGRDGSAGCTVSGAPVMTLLPDGGAPPDGGTPAPPPAPCPSGYKITMVLWNPGSKSIATAPGEEPYAVTVSPLGPGFLNMWLRSCNP